MIPAFHIINVTQWYYFSLAAIAEHKFFLSPLRLRYYFYRPLKHLGKFLFVYRLYQILERPDVKCVINILFVSCYKNDDGLFPNLHVSDISCQPHAVHVRMGAFHLYIQKHQIMLSAI